MNKADDILQFFKMATKDQFPSIKGHKCEFSGLEGKITITVYCNETDYLADCLTAEFAMNHYLQMVSEIWYHFEVQLVIAPPPNSWDSANLNRLVLAA